MSMLSPVLAQQGSGGLLIWFGIAALAVFSLIFLALFARYFGLWIQCKMTRAGISFPNLVMMSIRKVNPTVIVRSKIMAVQAGLVEAYPSLTTRALEAHYLANGDVPKVIRALVASHRARLDMDWQVAQAIDLAGRDVLDAVRTSVYPKVIDCPDPKKSAGTLDAMAGDGIQLKARARVTVRTNIQQLIGGATEETVIARVGQGIVQAIGSTDSYASVLENPDSISQTVLNQGLEAQTAFEIVSIDIADIDVGDNIGARLQALCLVVVFAGVLFSAALFSGVLFSAALFSGVLCLAELFGEASVSVLSVAAFGAGAALGSTSASTGSPNEASITVGAFGALGSPKKLTSTLPPIRDTL